ncbi:alkyl/aryl-sulfatase [Salininema proteolyticum]|uniref:Alkyl/aryl-sulfatase n=1 Tax=Salininema proteolyticum TaxID=1607685 RepID=A0ABV8U4F6_9ACTN
MTDLDFSDRTDFDNADRGYLGTLDDPVVRDEEGGVVWDCSAFDFLRGECPDTANPSLWRQGALASRHGLYEVCEGVYQVRGLDLSNMTLVETDSGVLVIDPLITVEVAAAGLDLYRRHRGDRPVKGVVYTHSHVDHFGGAGGVTDGSVPILAPDGFMDHAVSENVYAGTAMTRRSSYMYAMTLPQSPAGSIGVGLGQATSQGTPSLLEPTVDITETGQRETVDGLEIVFQVTPGTEAPSEMNFHFPRYRALCMAENASHTLHNILTLRGAEVRDSRMWARYLTEAIALFSDGTDVLFASHHWPTWGTEEIREELALQRDMYAYLHDQTVRMINQGYTGIEIAERFQLPPALERAWSVRGYYGSVSHNVKAVYQRYLGWFDGNPATLWEHPPAESAKRYVDCMGGADSVIAKARSYIDEGDLRFAVQLLNHAVFADPDNAEARNLEADCFETLGHGAENGPWRNFYLTGAQELREGIAPAKLEVAGSLSAGLSITQIFDTLAINVDAPRVWDDRIAIDWDFTDLGERHRTTLRNGVLVQEADPKGDGADLTVTLTKAGLLELAGGGRPDDLSLDGDESALQRLTASLSQPDPNFPIVTP